MIRSRQRRASPSPEVSVILATYNCGRYLPQAVESILTQTGLALEIITIDDGSTDDTPQVLAGFGARIRHLSQENQGSAAARNVGLREAHGPLIAFLDADDYYLPGKLAPLAYRLGKAPNLGMVHSGWRTVTEGGERITDVQPWQEAPSLDLESWLLKKPIALGPMMFRREVLQRVGGFDPGLTSCEDTDLVLRLSLSGCRAAWVRQLTLCYRRRPGSHMSDALRHAQAMDRVLERLFAHPELPARVLGLEPQVRYHSLVWEAWHLLSTGGTTEAVRRLSAAWDLASRQSPMTILQWYSRFSDWSRTAGYELEPPAEWLRTIRPALPEDLWDTASYALPMWADLLSPEATEQQPAAFEHYRSGTPAAFADRLRTTIRFAPTLVKPRRIAGLWAAAIRIGIVPPSTSLEVVTLYQASFRRAVFGRRWSSAAAALLRALGAGLSLGSVMSWIRFAAAPRGQSSAPAHPESPAASHDPVSD